MLIKRIKRFFNNSDGQVAVIVAFLLIFAFIPIMALVIDMGSFYEDRRSLQSIADAAALAGAQELPESPSDAEQQARDYISKNRPDISSIDVQVGSYLTANDKITVTVNNPDSTIYFGRVLGLNSINIGAIATAIVGKLRNPGNVVPWGKELSEGENWDDWELGDEFILKYGPTSGGPHTPGNFLALDLDGDRGGGTNQYYPRIVDGYEGRLIVGNTIYTEPGTMGQTDDKLYERLEKYGDGTLHEFGEIVDTTTGQLKVNNGQFIIVPIIPSLIEAQVNGNESFQILGFATFVVTEVIPENPNKGAIIGKFVRAALVVDSGDIDPVEEKGIRVIRLIE